MAHVFVLNMTMHFAQDIGLRICLHKLDWDWKIIYVTVGTVDLDI